MPVEVIMPKVDMDMERGTLARWHVAEGERVAQGAPLFDIETDKAAMEVDSPATGILRHLRAAEGASVPVGQPIAWIYAEGEADTPPPPDATPDTAPAAAISPEPGPLPPGLPEAARAAPPEPAGRSGEGGGERDGAGGVDPGRAARATPAARRLARAAGVALDDIAGTGPRGRRQADDVTRHLAAAAAGAGTQADAPLPAADTAWTPQPGPLHLTRRRAPGHTALRPPGTSGAAHAPARPVLMLHGFGADGTIWQPLESALDHALGAGHGHEMLRIDLPGHGRSPRRRIAGFAALARAVVEAVDAADFAPVHLVGHSLGGAVALALADIRPRAIATLTLIAPAGLGPEIDGEVLAGLGRARRAASLAPWLRRMVGDGALISDDYARAALRGRAGAELRAAQADMAEALFPDGVQGFSLAAALDRLETPARVIWGRRDRIIPWRHALECPGRVGLHLMAGIGHMPHLEAPEAVAEILRQQIAGAR